MARKQTKAKAVRIEITPTPSEYRVLCEDLRELRERGAETNTAAIVQAVRDAAAMGKMQAHSANGKGALERPNPRNRKVGS